MAIQAINIENGSLINFMEWEIGVVSLQVFYHDIYRERDISSERE